MRRALILLLLLGALHPLAVFGHGDEKHEDIRDTPATAPAPAAPPAPAAQQAPRQPYARYAAYVLLGGLLLATPLAFVLRRGRPLRGTALPLAAAWAIVGGGAAALLVWSERAPATVAPLALPPSRPSAAVTDSGVVVPADMQQNLGIRVAAARRQDITATVKVPGRILAPQGAVHSVHSPRTARVVSADLPYAGQTVARGGHLLSLEESLSASEQVDIRAQEGELQATRVELERGRMEVRARLAELEGRRQEASSQLAQRRSELVRAEKLFDIEVLAKKDLEAARFAVQQAEAGLKGLEAEITAQRQALGLPSSLPNLPSIAAVRGFSLTAPISGVVSEVDVAPGEIVEPSKQLIRIVNLSTVWVRAQVHEKELGLARAAQRARISTVSDPGPFYGKLLLVESRIDPETRSAGVIYVLANPGGRLLENMAAEVELLGATRREVTIPSAAVVTIERESRVFVRTAPDRFEVRSVTLGPPIGDAVVVYSGIEAGTPVVTQGAGQLASELSRRGGH